jgi:two-component sensor histidine kinase
MTKQTTVSDRGEPALGLIDVHRHRELDGPAGPSDIVIDRSLAEQLQRELEDARRLQEISTRLIQHNDVSALYDGVLDAAIVLMRSDMATMQVFDPMRGQLRLLGARGFDPATLGPFEWVSRDTGSSCAAAFRAGERVVIPDIDLCEFIVGTPAHGALRACGIRAAQSTPLFTRSGNLIGMITNHWRTPHEPEARELVLIDVLARQAADLIERKRNEEQIALLAREAEHRAKNVLATVQATVRLARADSVEGLKQAIEGRIQALANVHRLFAQTNWAGANVRDIVMNELSPYCPRGSERVRVKGPTMLLEPERAQTLAVTVHELATNAAKYGALSNDKGNVRVDWSHEADDCLVFSWTESNRPLVEAPSHRGFGTKVMQGMIEGQLEGEMRFDWRPEGLFCRIALPLRP